MMRVVVPVAIVLFIAIGGGAASAWYALRTVQGFNALRVGEWTAYPDRGTPRSDPYSKARFAREAELPLGIGEGLTFVAERDAAGQPLLAQCSYRIEGAVPASRLWTLYASRGDLEPLDTNLREKGLHSLQMVRRIDDSVAIRATPNVSAGNWLRTSGAGPMSFVLTFYDPPSVSGVEASDFELPRIYRDGCDA